MRRKDANKVDLIYRASLELIQKEGIAGLTMSKLAKRAGLATGTLYIYFESKEVLLNQLYIKLSKESLERFLKGYSEEETFFTGFKKIWLNYLKHRIEFYDESIFLEQYYRSPYIAPDHLKIAEAMKAPVHNMIQRGKDENQVRCDTDNEMLFLSMLGFIRELADEHITGVYELSGDRIEKAFEISWSSIKQ